MTDLVARIAVENTFFSRGEDFDYKIPPPLQQAVLPGVCVFVPFGRNNQKRHGVVLSVSAGSGDALKEILAVDTQTVRLSDECLQLAAWLKERCFSTSYACLRLMLPNRAGKAGGATEKMIRLCAGQPQKQLTAKQQAVINLLQDTGTVSCAEAKQFCSVGDSVLNTLAKYGAVEFYQRERLRIPYITEAAEPEDIILSAQQQTAFERLSCALESPKNEQALLFGVTGSGKTQVYLKLIDRVLEQGRDAIVLVPEIALTVQTISIFLKRYGNMVAVFHSGLSAGERYDAYKRAQRGDVKIVVGTRSAVFAPLQNLGLIVIDEEQEDSYKSEMSPRYNAKEVARFRCAYHKALLLLASATPRVETYCAAKNGKYILCKLAQRYGSAQLPQVVTVDMREEFRAKHFSPISSVLASHLRENFEAGNQAILLINRRGYNTFIACQDCGHVITCPNCSISMTYHSDTGSLHCHYCGYIQRLENTCPQCGGSNVRYSGYGTQRIEDELQALLPQARILRMDADTTAHKNAHDKLLNSFARREYDIMVGTQMVAKGLDFPSVRLVGVVNADNALYNECYNAAEKSFDLITQVIGRSGRRDATGTAVIQTIDPYNPTIEYAAAQDYASFYDTEIELRRLLIYPPFCDLLYILFSGENELAVAQCAQFFFTQLVQQNRTDGQEEKMIILGPSPAKILKISNIYRYHLIIKCKNSRAIRTLVRKTQEAASAQKQFKTIQITADFNPADMN